MNSRRELAVSVQPGVTTTALVYPAPSGRIGAALILAHGAGAGQLSPFMVDFARGLSALGLDVATFNFLYTEHRRRIPDRAPMLEACYRAVIDALAQELDTVLQFLFIGGKSMGGRIATQIAAADSSLKVSGIVLLGYPLHRPGRPTERRDAHLAAISRPVLFVQGSRDAFGTPGELEPTARKLPRPTALHIVDGGDHSFKLPGHDRARQAAAYYDAQRSVVEWVKEVMR